ncbi:MAG: glycosyltransferase, partial [Chloroflexi bacterium]|nr:glycosyltransferase [Chloroflexota bacterium]
MSVAEPIAATLPPTGSHSASPAPSGSRRLGGQFSIDLSIILVTFNSWSYVQRCLQLLPSACSGAMSEIIVIDNGSRDGTPERILQEFPDVTVVRLAQNVGFAAANNRGMIASRGRHVLLLNSDTEPAPESLTQLVKFLDDHLHVGIVAPRLLNTDGTDQGTARSFSGPLDAVLGRTSLVTKWFPNNLRARRTLYS